MKQGTAVWKAVEYPGMEYLNFWEQPTGVVVTSVVIGVRTEGAFRLNYSINYDDSYVVRAVRMALQEQDQELSLWNDENGNWYDNRR